MESDSDCESFEIKPRAPVDVSANAPAVNNPMDVDNEPLESDPEDEPLESDPEDEPLESDPDSEPVGKEGVIDTLIAAAPCEYTRMDDEVHDTTFDDGMVAALLTASNRVDDDSPDGQWGTAVEQCTQSPSDLSEIMTHCSRTPIHPEAFRNKPSAEKCAASITFHTREYERKFCRHPRPGEQPCMMGAGCIGCRIKYNNLPGKPWIGMIPENLAASFAAERMDGHAGTFKCLLCNRYADDQINLLKRTELEPDTTDPGYMTQTYANHIGPKPDGYSLNCCNPLSGDLAFPSVRCSTKGWRVYMEGEVAHFEDVGYPDTVDDSLANVEQFNHVSKKLDGNAVGIANAGSLNFPRGV